MSGPSDPLIESKVLLYVQKSLTGRTKIKVPVLPKCIRVLVMEVDFPPLMYPTVPTTPGI